MPAVLTCRHAVPYKGGSGDLAPRDLAEEGRNPMQPFVLSIEPVGKPAFVDGFHLGTDERLARQLAEERFHGRNGAGLWTCTVALLRAGRLVAVYDGRWSKPAAS